MSNHTNAQVGDLQPGSHNDKLESENQAIKEILARPLQEIIQENADLKIKVKEKDQLLAMWLLRQRAMKKVALEFAKKSGKGNEEVVSLARQMARLILTEKNDLDGIVIEESMKFLQDHKDYLLENAF